MEKTPHVMLVGSEHNNSQLVKAFRLKKINFQKMQQAYDEWLKKSEYKPQINIENTKLLPEHFCA